MHSSISKVSTGNIHPWLQKSTKKSTGLILIRSFRGDDCVFYLLISSLLASANVSRNNSFDILSAVKVLCFVETCQKNLMSKALAVRETWGKRCDKTIYISDSVDTSFPTITLSGVLPGHEQLWSKTALTIIYLAKNYADQFHWFLKADDDTYVIVENLKAFLALHSPEKLRFFGKRFKMFGGYNSGGAGYVLGREALKRMAAALNSKNPACSPIASKMAEDVATGKCLASAGVHPGNTLDRNSGKELFHSFSLSMEVSEDPPKWMYSYSFNPVQRVSSL